MDSKHGNKTKKPGSQALQQWGGPLFFVGAILTAWVTATHWKPASIDTARKTTVADWLVTSYTEAWTSTQQKVDTLKHLDEQNAKLELENAHLRLTLESGRFECSSLKAEKSTQTFENKLHHDTGTKTGRTLASIPYKVPTDLSDIQLFQLANGYFNHRDDEKAAVIFSFLTGLEDDNTFKTAPGYLKTGITWYRLDNMELADFYFEKVAKFSFSSQTQTYINQARLWRGIVAERLGDHKKSQGILREIMDHNPHSTEAALINRDAIRAPAAKVASKEGAEKGSPEASAEKSSSTAKAERAEKASQKSGEEDEDDDAE
jgi:tetratricopeptide (TPR) repeat protein